MYVYIHRFYPLKLNNRSHMLANTFIAYVTI